MIDSTSIVVDDATRAAALGALRQEALRLGRDVFGEGNAAAGLVIVGEAPGREEELQGRPFVGRAGKQLDQLLGAAGMARGDIWVTNAVKHRPTKIVAGVVRTRPPTVAEIAADLLWLERELAIVKPAVILALGCCAVRALIGRRARIGLQRGRWLQGATGVPVLATFHPASLFRQSRANRERMVAHMREDLAAVRRAMEVARQGSVHSSLIT